MLTVFQSMALHVFGHNAISSILRFTMAYIGFMGHTRILADDVIVEMITALSAATRHKHGLRCHFR